MCFCNFAHFLCLFIKCYSFLSFLEVIFTVFFLFSSHLLLFHLGKYCSSYGPFTNIYLPLVRPKKVALGGGLLASTFFIYCFLCLYLYLNRLTNLIISGINTIQFIKTKNKQNIINKFCISSGNISNPILQYILRKNLTN